MNDENVKWVGVAVVNIAVAGGLIYSLITASATSDNLITLVKSLLVAGCLFGAGRALLKLRAKR